MAKTSLSKATGVTYGYGQVEPNHLSAQRTGQIYAQLPATITVENGQFVKYDLGANEGKGEINVSGKGEWMLAFSEVKVYGDYETAQDFVIEKDGYPRVFKTNIGDIFTTNCTAAKPSTYTAGTTTLVPDDNGILKDGSEGDMVWEVVDVTTMPDGQEAVKVIRIK